MSSLADMRVVCERERAGDSGARNLSGGAAEAVRGGGGGALRGGISHRVSWIHFGTTIIILVQQTQIRGSSPYAPNRFQRSRFGTSRYVDRSATRQGGRPVTDRISPQARSRNMQRIKAKDTTPELTVRRYFHAHGLRYSLHRYDLPGRPDMVLVKYRTVVQVQGCFWHQHPDSDCRDARIPKSNHDYWIPKLRRTMVRGRRELRRAHPQGMGC